MKRTYLARRNALFSPENISWGAYALLFSILLLCMRLIVPNVFTTIFTPVFRASDSLAQISNSFFNSFADTARLAQRNEALERENASLALQNQMLIQNANVVSALAQGGKNIVAGVVARPPESPYDTLVLARGTADGVTVGMEAFGLSSSAAGAGGMPLGIVTSVTAGFSRVTLFSAPTMTLNGWVGKVNVPVSITGAGGGAMRASVARSAGISEGDEVFAPGPGMLVIGTVARIDSNSSSPSVVLRIRPALNLFSTAWVALRDTGMKAFVLATSTSL